MKQLQCISIDKLIKPYITILLLILSFTSCATSEKEKLDSEISNEIDNYLTRAMELHNIPGLALAVIEEDDVVYESYFGQASLEDGSLVDDKTMFRIFSATKLITTTGVFQLIENGQLGLEDKISKYLSDLPVAWQQVKIKNLLSHSSGIPDIIRYESTLSDKELMEKLSMDKMQFQTGTQFSYNQTNYWLLGQIIEQISGKTFDDYIIGNQFDNNSNGVLFSSNSQENIPNRATRYLYSGKNKKFVKGTNNNGRRGHSGNGLNITLNKFMEWDSKLKLNQLLGEKAKSDMWSPFDFKQDFKYQKDNFLHGWHNYHVNGLDSYGFSGGNLAAYRIFPKSNTTIILLSNGSQIEAYDIIVNDVARMVMPELKTKDLTLEEDVMELILDEQYDLALAGFQKLKEENPSSQFDNLKLNINGIGNSYSWNGEPEKAFKVFKMNAEANPNWWIAVAGLAEMQEVKKDTIQALKNYQWALLLNEKNEYGYNDVLKSKINQLKQQ
ncbi:serine hydrolase [Flagellimonas lutimaris]|uniref:Serine hydrolase n=1 Tax=Flagellimonas lutimaris TaxID=475082 RepID=A0A3A1N595_9FLAO|nr:serine hydrolase domain-containing protein [Allomuricauda lutimaris]RIV31569.1 serine hydrolase [Allomuricauda lutimaris]